MNASLPSFVRCGRSSLGDGVGGSGCKEGIAAAAAVGGFTSHDSIREQSSDSLILQWSRRSEQLSRKHVNLWETDNPFYWRSQNTAIGGKWNLCNSGGQGNNNWIVNMESEMKREREGRGRKGRGSAALSCDHFTSNHNHWSEGIQC